MYAASELCTKSGNLHLVHTAQLSNQLNAFLSNGTDLQKLFPIVPIHLIEFRHGFDPVSAQSQRDSTEF